MSDTTAVPAGYLKDAKGRLIPDKLVSAIDKERDSLVKELFGIAKALNAEMVKTKARVFGDVNAFVALSAERYNAKMGGTKGNITLHSFDGQFRVQVATAESIRFDEGLQAAKKLIDECIGEWSADSPPEIKLLISDAFQTDKEGNLNTGRILGLRRYTIDDPRWQAAMTAIGESLTVVGSKQYVRFYERVGDTDKYLPISLDIAAV